VSPNSAQPTDQGGPHEVPGAGAQTDEQKIIDGAGTNNPDGSSEPNPPAWDAGLQPKHRALIVASAISPDVAAERGYRSITVKAELLRMGFKPAQAIVPALYIPVIGLSGEAVNHQIRPDVARVGRNGKAVKYETPAGSRMAIDIPPRVRPVLGDPKIPLFLTEGIRKADSAASHDVPCLAFLGVWNWRGTNDHGGSTALPEFESIAWNDRRVYVVYDSDVTVKPSVWQALRRLKEFLEYKKAEVWIVYLPDGPHGEKIGLDDYLATGKTREDLLQLARRELPPKPSRQEESLSLIAPIYRATESGIVRVSYDDEGNEELFQVTNFTAEISANVLEDDGANSTRHFEVMVRRQGEEREVEIPASEFSSMDWVPKHLGAEYIVLAGMGNRDHARAATQILSKDIDETVVHVHTGWGRYGADGAYLHGEGAIGASGAVDGISVRLPANLGSFVLPAPPTGLDLRAAVRASMQVLDLAPERISAPIFAATYRAPLCSSDFSVALTGTTGTFKTECAALAQQHYGKEFGPRNLPGSWSSTGNALETNAHTMKDALFVIDDFVPHGGPTDVLRIHREADRLLRAQGNNSGRQRLNADGTLRPTRAPRGLVLSTGEDVPAGHSLRARMMIVEMSPDDVSVTVLTSCQKAAREGLYAAAMAGYVRWLAGQRKGMEERVRKRATEIRAEISEHSESSHRRTPDVVAQLFVGIEMFAQFALEVGAIASTEFETLRARCWTGLLESASRQTVLQEAADPVPQFIMLLQSALSAGEAHLRDERGQPPDGWSPEVVGWEAAQAAEMSGPPTWRPRGACVGWIIENELFLDGPSAYRSAQRMADEAGRVGVSQGMLGRRLAERGHLVSQDKSRMKCTIRKYIQGVRHDVLHLRLSLLLGQRCRPSIAGPVADLHRLHRGLWGRWGQLWEERRSQRRAHKVTTRSSGRPRRGRTMTSRPLVADIRFTEASAPFKSKGLLGWVCAKYGDLQLDGLRVLRTEDRRHMLGFPSHVDANGVSHAYYRPLDQAARDEIEAQVLGELRRRGKLPPSPHSRSTATSRERGGAS
jgi:hypothetical protein